MSNILLVVLLLGLIIFSGFFSSAEIAFFSINKIKLKSFEKSLDKRLRLIASLRKNRDRLLVTILIGNNVTNILTSAIATYWAVNFFGSTGVGIVTGILTFFILVFGEIIPKSIATEHAETVAYFAVAPIYFLTLLLYPLNSFFISILKYTHKLFSSQKDNEQITIKDIAITTQVCLEDGVINQHVKTIIHNILEVNTLVIDTMYKPLEEVCMFEANFLISNFVKTDVSKKYSRIPIYEKVRTNIIGYIHSREILRVKSCHWNTTKMQFLLLPSLIISTEDTLSKTYNSMINEHVHLAIVVNEAKITIGILTLEDLFEKILGDIQDETDNL